MKQRKSKCTCAQRGVMCGRKLSLIKQRELANQEIRSEEIVCPLKSVLTYAS